MRAEVNKSLLFLSLMITLSSITLLKNPKVIFPMFTSVCNNFDKLFSVTFVTVF